MGRHPVRPHEQEIMNVPATVQSAQYDYFVPPMTPVFATQQAPRSSWQTKRNSTRTSDTGIPEGHGQHYDGSSGEYSNKFFIGVTTEGLPGGADVVKHGAKMGHFTVITRGIVTVMCDYHDVCSIKMGTLVKVKKSDHKFRGMPINNFSLTSCTNPADEVTNAIGILLSKPSEDDKANEARLLLL